jgi:serine protease
MRLRLIVSVVAVWSGLAATMAAAPAQETLRVPTGQPSVAEMRARGPSSQVIVKFKERTDIRIRGGEVRNLAGPDRDGLADVLAAAGLTFADFRRLHARPEVELDVERAEAQRESRRALADLNLYYRLRVPNGVDAVALAEQLGRLPVVEFAEPAGSPPPSPGDIPPDTPQLKKFQGYRKAGDGVGTLKAQGGNGKGIRVVDVEYNWNLGHEDLDLPGSTNIDNETIDDPFPSDQGSHGTAVLGQIGGLKNGYGVEGLATGAKIYVAPTNTVQSGFSVARALGVATGKLKKGDAILIEQQAPVCGGVCGGSQVGCGPVEYFQAEFDAISTATAKGIIVVEAAGNGNVNLDSGTCNGRFDRNVRDSGAIIVGAGHFDTHERLSFSTYGSRVDVQGWGHEITTTGYGDAFDPGDILQRYTHSFGGTSGASPIVTGVVLQIQGALKAQGLKLASPEEMRKALLKGGIPQPTTVTPIGPLPQTQKAYEWMLKKRGVSPNAPDIVAAAE